MQIFGFILLAGIWAVFLFPRFIESRRHAPIATTRDYARSTALLASVAAMSTQQQAVARRRVLRRRRRALIALVLTPLVALTMAIWQNSLLWMGVTIVADLALAAYIAVLLHMKQQPSDTAAVVRLPLAGDRPVVEHRSTVRIVAG